MCWLKALFLNANQTTYSNNFLFARMILNVYYVDAQVTLVDYKTFNAYSLVPNVTTGWFIWNFFTKIVSQQTCVLYETFFVKKFQMNEPVVPFAPESMVEGDTIAR